MHISTLSLTAAGLLVGTGVSARPLPHYHHRRQAAAGEGRFGKCTVPTLAFGHFDNRKETSFNPGDPNDYPHGSAQNPKIIEQFLCDNLVNACGLQKGDPGHNDCLAATSAANAVADQKSGGVADAWNEALGVTSAFAGVEVIDNQGNVVQDGTAPADAPTLVVQDGQGGGGAAADPAPASTTAEAATATAAPAPACTVAAQPAQADQVDTDAGAGADAGTGDFGKCSAPTLVFGHFDNRKETAFNPGNPIDYPHGSAKNQAIITQFLCDQLINNCGLQKGDPGHNACLKATGAANAVANTLGGEAADAFNAEIGVTSNFAGVEILNDQGGVVRAGTTPADAPTLVVDGSGAADPAPAEPDTATATQPAAAEPTQSATPAPSTSPNGANLQNFDGALGGIRADDIIAGGRIIQGQNVGFTELGDGSTAVNFGAAAQRACDRQKNACFNLANGNKNSGVSTAQCETQHNECIKANAGGPKSA